MNKHVQHISFRQCITFCEHRQLKGWPARFQPTEASSSVYSSHMKTQSVCCNSVTRPSASLHMTDFFCSCNEGMGIMQPFCRADGVFRSPEDQASGTSREWMLGIPRKNGGNGFLKETCPSNLVWQRVTFCKHAQMKGWPPRFQQQLKGWQTHVQLTVAKSSISTNVRWFAAVT